MISFENLTGMGYDGYAMFDGIVLPIIKAGNRKEDNNIKGQNGVGYSPNFGFGAPVANGRRSFTADFEFELSKNSWRFLTFLLNTVRYEAPTIDLTLPLPIQLFLSSNSQIKTQIYVESVGLNSAVDALITFTVSGRGWLWDRAESWVSSTEHKVPMNPMDPNFSPLVGYQSCLDLSMYPEEACQGYSLQLNNKWSFEEELTGLNYFPPNPNLVTFEGADVSLTAEWLHLKEKPEPDARGNGVVNFYDPEGYRKNKKVLMGSLRFPRLVRNSTSQDNFAVPNAVSTVSGTYELVGEGIYVL